MLYPIAAAEWRPDEWWARFLPALDPPAARTGVAGFAAHASRSSRSCSTARRWAAPARWASCPSTWTSRDVLGWSRVRAIAFPLYLALEDADARRTWMPFPLVSIVDGPAARGFAAFPFYGETTIADGESSGFALWPFVTWDDRTTPAGVRATPRLLPALATIDGPERTTRGYGLVGWIHSIDRRRGTR